MCVKSIFAFLRTVLPLPVLPLCAGALSCGPTVTSLRTSLQHDATILGNAQVPRCAIAMAPAYSAPEPHGLPRPWPDLSTSPPSEADFEM